MSVSSSYVSSLTLLSGSYFSYLYPFSVSLSLPLALCCVSLPFTSLSPPLIFCVSPPSLFLFLLFSVSVSLLFPVSACSLLADDWQLAALKCLFNGRQLKQRERGLTCTLSKNVFTSALAAVAAEISCRRASDGLESFII